MLQKINLHNVLFFDIEIVPVKEEFSDLSETQQQLFNNKTAYPRKEAKLQLLSITEQVFGQNIDIQFQ